MICQKTNMQSLLESWEEKQNQKLKVYRLKRMAAKVEGRDWQEIPLTRGEKAIIDTSDFDEISKFNWMINSGRGRKYASLMTGKLTVMMHRFILNPPKDMFVDHINGNSLDNRRSNLRICTHRQNCMNRSSINKYGFTGVNFDPRSNRYYSHMFINGKLKHLGSFKTAKEAGQRYADIAKFYYGEFTNHKVIQQFQ